MKTLKSKILPLIMCLILSMHWSSHVHSEELQKIEISGKLSSQFGNRYHPVYKTIKFHSGIDVTMKQRELHSPVSGTVIFAKWYGEYGNTIKIENDNVVYMFSHLSKIVVNVGDTVEVNDIIGIIGRTGLATGIHLHVEVINKGKISDPLLFFRIVSEN